MEPEVFGKLPTGEVVYRISLCNKNGLQATVITFGAALQSLYVPDKRGQFHDVTLGYNSLDGYINDNAYLGVIVGRYGNRIKKGSFQLGSATYNVTINDGKNHLHGGIYGFHKKVWKIITLSEKPHQSVQLQLHSTDGEEGYPGNITVTVEYCLTDENELIIRYRGKTDKTTILNPTFHGYFNLTGDHMESILDHELQIAAEYYTQTDEELIPTGTLTAVDNTPLDFRSSKRIGQRINEQYEALVLGKGYDHNFVLNNYNKQVRLVASLMDPRSGRKMEVLTDQPGLQFYSGNFLTPMQEGKQGVKHYPRTGLCLEAQAFPDSPNKPHFPSVELRPDELYTQITIYKFSTI